MFSIRSSRLCMQVANFHTLQDVFKSHCVKEKDLFPLGTAIATRERAEGAAASPSANPTGGRHHNRHSGFSLSSPLSATSPRGDKEGSRQVHWTSCLHKTSVYSGPHLTLHPSHHKEIIYCFMLFKASSQKPLLGRMICIRFLIG